MFYGWIVVAAVLVSSVGAATMEQFGFSAFVRPMSEALGWKRSLVASGISVRIIAGALLATALGSRIDRRGVRGVMLLAGVIGGSGALLLAGVSQPWQFLMLLAIAGGITSAGAGEFMVGTVIPKWFVAKRGRALAFGTMGGVLVGVFITPVLANLIARFGWQSGWIFVGLLMLLTIVPASFFMRRRPEDMGQHPDGLAPLTQNDGPQSAPFAQGMEIAWTRRQAVRTPVFWLMLLAFNLSGLAITGVVVHELGYLTGRGYEAGAAAFVVSLHAFSGICGRFVWGYLVERIPVRFCLSTIYLGAAIATVLLINASALWIALIFATLYGINIGGDQLLNASAWSNYYGREFVGAIRGVALPVQVVARAIGPILSGFLFDVTGSYVVPLSIFVATFTASGLLFSVLKPPVMRSRVAEVR